MASVDCSFVLGIHQAEPVAYSAQAPLVTLCLPQDVHRFIASQSVSSEEGPEASEGRETPRELGCEVHAVVVISIV